MFTFISSPNLAHSSSGHHYAIWMLWGTRTTPQVCNTPISLFLYFCFSSLATAITQRRRGHDTFGVHCGKKPSVKKCDFAWGSKEVTCYWKACHTKAFMKRKLGIFQLLATGEGHRGETQKESLNSSIIKKKKNPNRNSRIHEHASMFMNLALPDQQYPKDDLLILWFFRPHQKKKWFWTVSKEYKIWHLKKS